MWFKNFKVQSARSGWKIKGQISKPLRNRFFNHTEVAFWAIQEAENDSKVRWENVNLRFIDFFFVAFWVGQEVEIEFKVECKHIKRRFFNLTWVAFSSGQEARNEIKAINQVLASLFERMADATG